MTNRGTLLTDQYRRFAVSNRRDSQRPLCSRPLSRRWRGQRLDRGAAVGQFDVRVDAKRQPNVRMPRQRLGHLGRYACAGQAGDEPVPQAVEIGV